MEVGNIHLIPGFYKREEKTLVSINGYEEPFETKSDVCIIKFFSLFHLKIKGEVEFEEIYIDFWYVLLILFQYNYIHSHKYTYVKIQIYKYVNKYIN